MKKSLFALTSLVVFAVSASIGCAAESSDQSPGEEAGSEEDLTARQLPGVIAIEIAEVRAQTEVLSSKTIGAPKKVKSVVAAVKKLRPTDPVPRCMMRDTSRLTFFNAEGKKIATVSSYCGGYGSIDFENGSPGYGVRFSDEAVEKAKDAPFAVGDALWGITKIEVSKPGRDEKKTVQGADMKPILDGFNLDEVPDANAAFPRCLPSHAVAFIRANDQVASSSFLCGRRRRDPRFFSSAIHRGEARGQRPGAAARARRREARSPSDRSPPPRSVMI